MTPLPPNDRLGPYGRFGPYALIMRDVADGRLYMQLTTPEGVKVTRWNCICHPRMRFKRPHFTCLLFCRTKRMVQGKLPPLIPVNRYMMYIHVDRGHSRLKDWLLRKLVFPIAEFLAN